MQFWKLYKVPLVLAIVSFTLYWVFAYDLSRTEYFKLIGLYTLLFSVFIVFMTKYRNYYGFLAVIAFLSRAVFIIAIPNLSQDFYRFIWDGRMILEGFNPYLYTPESFLNNNEFPINQAQELFDGMGNLNASHFTNYPPINQLCFVIAAMFSGNSILGAVVVMRLIIIAADLGTLVVGRKFLHALNLPEGNIFWFILNPFTIIELTGNLHFEGVMIFFLIWSLYLLNSGRWKLAAIIFALSISVKLIPLMFLPLFFKYFRSKGSEKIDFKTLIIFYGIVGLTTILLFAPFFSMEFLNNYSETVALWFNNFEFNASVYYILREIGYIISGYNEIAVIGKILPLTVLLIILYISFTKRPKDFRSLILYMLLVFTAYLFLSTTVHPWYLSTLIVFGIFTNFRYPIVWSFVIILSYLAYLNINKADKSENLWIILVEYLIVYGVCFWELLRISRKKELKRSS